MKFDGKLHGRQIFPRAPRVSVNHDVIVRCAATQAAAKILNMSRNGFRLRTCAELESGSEITLEMPMLDPVKALVRWSNAGEAGGVFLEPMAL